MISSFLITLWDHTYGCAKYYHYTSDIYLLSYLDLYFSIIFVRTVGTPGHFKNVFIGPNYRDKQIIKSEMAKLLNIELICDDPVLQDHACSKDKKLQVFQPL